MKDTALDSYVYAKVCGMLSKSFVGKGFSRLLSVASLEELWHLLFGSACPHLSSSELAEMIEHKMEGLFLEKYISLLNFHPQQPQFLVDLIRLYDYENLKELLFFFTKGDDSSPGKPEMNHIEPFSMLQYDKWPDIKALVDQSPVAWCAERWEALSQVELEARLDLQYVRDLWHSLCNLKDSARDSIKMMLKEELLMENLVWSLRLRVYFGMEGEDVLQRLVTLKDVSHTGEIYRDELAGPVAKTLDYSIHNYQDWCKGDYTPFVNPPDDNDIWTIDPRWVYNAAHQKMFYRWKRQFHQNHTLSHVLYCWFKIKRYELDCIRAVTECIRLGLPVKQVSDLLKVSVV